MPSKILYFPYINIPNNPWTIKSLLFWDEIATITPIGFEPNLSPFMQDAIEHGLVKPIFPEYLNINFTRLQSKIETSTDLEERRQRFKNKDNQIQISRSKFTDELFGYLKDEGLAEPKDDSSYPDWYMIEKDTANMMMLYLANEVSKEGDYTPATDRLENLPVRVDNRNKVVKKNDVRTQVLTDILPYPTNPDLSDLAEFKHMHRAHLLEFRESIEDMIATLAEQPENIRKDMMQDRVVKIREHKEKLLELLNEGNRFKEVLLSTVIGLEFEVLSLNVFKAHHTVGLPTMIAVFLTSLFENRSRDPIHNDRYAYLALLDRRYV